MSESGISEDFCRCGHVASAHENGDSECITCKTDGRSVWAMVTRCYRFSWAETWQTSRSA